MGVTLTIFSLSGKIPCDKDKSKICFSGAANSPKQSLITLALASSIPGILLGLWNFSFSSFSEAVCSGNLVFSINFQKNILMVVFSLPALAQFLQKVIQLICYFFFVKNDFSVDNNCNLNYSDFFLRIFFYR